MPIIVNPSDDIPPEHQAVFAAMCEALLRVTMVVPVPELGTSALGSALLTAICYDSETADEAAEMAKSFGDRLTNEARAAYAAIKRSQRRHQQ